MHLADEEFLALRDKLGFGVSPDASALRNGLLASTLLFVLVAIGLVLLMIFPNAFRPNL
jgi:hypothetical protein